jgi:hypothetical protein
MEYRENCQDHRRGQQQDNAPAGLLYKEEDYLQDARQTGKSNRLRIAVTLPAQNVSLSKLL